ncbi:MAG: ABC transporter ATP-binding protein, partial [Nocardiopsaceae bacterium]|nr:ABC transporter ATP-binding protein [Nocardiopsaceae bacterium]
GSPSLVLCDEPVSSLDVSVQATILNLFADFQRSTNVAYLFVSHDLGVVRYLADRIIVMYRGRVLEEGLASDVFNPPHPPYTEALFSALPVLGDTGSQHRIRLAGEMPAAGDSPEGCCFQSRCPRKLGAICEEEKPPERLFGNGHVVRCHLTGDQLMEVQRQRPKARI